MHADLKSRSFSSGALITAVALFVAVFGNFAFYDAAFRIFGFNAESLLLGAGLAVTLSSIFVLFLSALCHRLSVKPVLIAFLLISATVAYFTNSYGTIFDTAMLSNVFQTDTAEARDLFSWQLVLYIAGLGILPSLAIWYAPLETPHWMTETVSRLKLAGTAVLAVGAVYLAFGAHIASLVREHRDVVSKVNPGFAIVSAIKLAAQSLPSGPHVHTLVAADAAKPEADGHNELIIMVVGETARADHWQLNGYARETTPLIKKEGVYNFPDFWSCGTSTAISVPCMFSNLGRGHFESGTAQATDNALDVLGRAGVSILWRDNNSSSKGVADRVQYEDFKTHQLNPMCDEECRDEGMLSGLQQYIDAQKGDILIVLHQMGNHGPAYYKRYPKAFEVFAPVCKTNDLGSCSTQEINNAYDNALRYTDYFLSKVIDLLKKNDRRFETAMFYVSDHGESLGEYGVYLHGMPYALAPEAQRHVPAVLWLGSQIKRDIDVSSVPAQSQKTWSHDNLFSTLLGLFEIRTEAYDAKMDILQHPDTELTSTSN
jgi:lipid A ethanolaminephosphotransferase